MVKHQWYTTPLANAVHEIMNQHDRLFVIPGRKIAHISCKYNGAVTAACGLSATYRYSEVSFVDTPSRVCEQCVIRRLLRAKGIQSFFIRNSITHKIWREFLLYLRNKQDGN